MFSLRDVTNAITDNAIAVSNNAGFITTYHLSRDLDGGSKLKRAGSQILPDPAYFNPWCSCYESTARNSWTGALETKLESV